MAAPELTYMTGASFISDGGSGSADCKRAADHRGKRWGAGTTRLYRPRPASLVRAHPAHGEATRMPRFQVLS